VSVGMLFNPGIILSDPGPVLVTLFIIMVGKSIAAFAIVKAFAYPSGTAALIAASLGQIGEFSFILAELGVGLGFLPEEARDLVITGAMLSIILNPLLFLFADRFAGAKAAEPGGDPAERSHPVATALSGHAVLVGFGRVGQIV